MTAGKEIAYVTSRYPAVSHTFVVGEVQALRRQGLRVRTFSVRRVERDQLLSDLDRAEHAATVALLPPTARSLLAAAVAVVRSPAAAVAAGRRARSAAAPGVRGLLWQLFYLVEAVLLFTQLRRTNVTHVHAHFANVGADVARLCAAFGTAATGRRWTWSFTMHGPTEFANEDHFRLATKAGDADLVVCISDYARSQLQRLTAPDVWPRLHVVHCGVDGTRFRPVDRPRTGGRLRILCVGRLVADKGQTVLLEAFAGLRAAGVDAHLDLVGDGPLRRELEHRTRSLGIADHVTFAGAVGQHEMPGWYDRADVFCLASFAEGVPIVLMEAMAAGLAVVATRITGIPELVEDGVSGVLVTPSRVGELTGALLELARDPARRQELGRKGRDVVLEHFDVDANAAVLASRFAAL